MTAAAKVPLYTGADFLVRSIDKRDGSVAYALCRPAGAVLDEFPSAAEAIFVARQCEASGGSYGAEIRNPAKQMAKKLYR